MEEIVGLLEILSLDTDINVHTGSIKVAPTPKKYENLKVEYNRGSIVSRAEFIGIRAIDDNGTFKQCLNTINMMGVSIVFIMEQKMTL